MEKEKNLTTAANSKTMNAIETEKLFAAAGEKEQAIDFLDGQKQPGPANTAAAKTGKKKAERNPSRKKHNGH